MDNISILLIIILALYLYDRFNKQEHFATFDVPPGTDNATAKLIGKAQEVGAGMCSNASLDYINKDDKKKHNSCGGE
jgi:hypothetical protein